LRMATRGLAPGGCAVLMAVTAGAARARGAAAAGAAAAAAGAAAAAAAVAEAAAGASRGAVVATPRNTRGRRGTRHATTALNTVPLGV